MEGSVRSGVLKKKSSSGCLIIKKKGESKNSGGVLGGLSGNSSEKKSPRLVASGSSSSDEDESLEFMRRRVNDKRSQNGSMGYKRSELENREYHRNNLRMDISGEKKRNRLHLFDFDEYDEFDGKKMRGSECVEDRFMMAGHKVGGNLKEFCLGSSSRNLLVDKRKHDFSFHGSGSGRSKGIEYGGMRNKGVELEEDEALMPISRLKLKHQGMANEPIRLQGKNGVLKVMVNKKNKTDMPSGHKNYNSRGVEEGKGSRSEDAVNKDLLRGSPIYPKPSKSLGLFAGKEKSVEKEKMGLKLEKVKPILDKGKKARDFDVDGTDTVLTLAPPGVLFSASKRGVKMEEEKSPPPENITPVKGNDSKEGKAKRGGSTEKQMLREKIRGMLIDAGWSIDYRPRRNRDYLDAVYINPSGTAYWSIIKAYDALKKQLDEDNDKSKVVLVSPSFAPLADDMIHKLTRQTKKKIEEELKRKRKENGSSKSAKRSVLRETAENSDSDQNEERPSSHVKQNFESRRGKLHAMDQEIEDDLSDDSWRRKPKKVRGEKHSIVSNSDVLQGRTSRIIGRCTLLVRGSKGGNLESDGYVPYRGKRTLLAWLIDSRTAQLSEKVQYMNRKRNRVMLEGWITRDGIHCGCCSKILTVSKFELHAGSKLRLPFQNIFLESGVSLLQCQLDAWNRQEESLRRDFLTVHVDGDDPDDDTCGICGDGGDLICCDGCPSTFHQICLGIQMLPSGDWHCPNCTCKFCGNADVPYGNDSAADEFMRCSFCEKKYHQSCSKEKSAPSTLPNGLSFCGSKCQELHDHLQKNLGVKHELEAGYSWSLIQRMDASDTSHRGFPQRVECNSKLAVALTVMDECFLPVIDRRSGINILRNVIYNCGSNFNRLNYRGFYTVILERGDEIISAASIRIHGTRLAEMPFIGTREIYRRQGMCRRLLTAIETVLSSLRVEQLIIPAISEHMNTWTSVFGFHPLENMLKKEMKSMNMLVFPGTDMLQKPLVKQEFSDGKKVFESIKIQMRLPLLSEKSDVHSSTEHKRQASHDSGPRSETKTGEDNDLKSSSPRPVIPSNDNKTGASANSVCGSEEDGLVSAELENDKKEHFACLSPASAPGEINKISGMEDGLQDRPNGKTNINVEAVAGSACENETSHHAQNATETSLTQKDSSLESANVQNGVLSSIGFTKDANPRMCETQPGFVLEISAVVSEDKDNGECIAVANGESLVKSSPDLNRPTPLSQEPSPDSNTKKYPKAITAAGGGIGSSSSDVYASEKCDGTKENVEGCGFSSFEDSGTEGVETVDKDKSPVCNIFPYDGIDPLIYNAESNHKAKNELDGPFSGTENYNPVGESELPHVDGKVSSSISFSGNPAEKAAATKNHAGLSNGVVGNGE